MLSGHTWDKYFPKQLSGLPFPLWIGWAWACLQHFCLQQWMRYNFIKGNARILAGGSLGIFSFIYIRVVNTLFLSIFHTHRSMGRRKWEVGVGKRQHWAGQWCPMGSVQPFSPLSSLFRALRMFQRWQGRHDELNKLWNLAPLSCDWPENSYFRRGWVCRPHQLTARSGLSITLGFHGLTLARVAKFSVMTSCLFKNQSPLKIALARASFQLWNVTTAFFQNTPQWLHFCKEMAEHEGATGEWGESRAVCPDRTQTQPPHTFHGWNQTQTLEGISFLMRGEGICGSQKAAQVMDVVTFKISLCILPHCSPGTYCKNFCVQFIPKIGEITGLTESSKKGVKLVEWSQEQWE